LATTLFVALRVPVDDEATVEFLESQEPEECTFDLMGDFRKSERAAIIVLQIDGKGLVERRNQTLATTAVAVNMCAQDRIIWLPRLTSTISS
jgi:hypothetical protein